jgi:A/G-specific adenine glycosylase
LARIVSRDHDGIVPDDPTTLETLPGIGRYTAGAVATFAYEKRAPAVDTNVSRVLTRVFALGSRRSGNHGGAATLLRPIWELAERLLPRKPAVAWEFNQALMDLGARICTARQPRCAECPVRPACRTGRRT